MPSIFTRSRTASSPAKSIASHKGSLQQPLPTVPPDEFGRVVSRGSTLSKKDKKKESKSRSRTHSIPQELVLPTVPEGGYLPFSLAPPEGSEEQPRQQLQGYGYLSYQNEVVLGLEEVTRLVSVISHELGQRGLTTPLLFSNLALDISPSRIRRLIDTFLRTCTSHHSDSNAEEKWREEAQFSGPHELAMTLRWGLARIVRIYQGQETRGILSWESYLRWREDEGAMMYPADYFGTYLTSVPTEARPLLSILLSFLSRLAAHSTSSGLTPPALSSLFGPLLFGLGSHTLPFHHTYGAYLRCSHATEHILLAYIRAQDVAASHAVSLPSRLKDWIRGYPAMIPPMDKLDKARQGARTVRVTSVRRNVRLYSFDLVKTGASWAAKSEPGDLKGCKEWMRVTGPPNAGLVPRYSDQYRKRLDIHTAVVPDMGSEAASQTSSMGSTTVAGDDFGGLLGKEEEKRFRSLTELKWGEFESLGFGDGDGKRLEFDLNEGARTARTEKRSTLSWNDFSTSGFSRTDAPLSATLQFATPIATTISAWPTRQTELQSKLKKTQKSLPPFGWDTSPVLLGEEAVEEGFLEVFCDLLYGTGWLDRREQTFRECNWALIEYKSMPQTRPVGLLPSDPRTAASLWLYEEFVPLEYRSQLTAPKRKIRVPFTSGVKHWKPATTLNGKPYVMGNVPRTPTTRELEFEGLLTGGGGNVTKVIRLGRAGVAPESIVSEGPAGGGETAAGGLAGKVPPPVSASTTSPPQSTEAAVPPSTPTSAGVRRSRFLGSTRIKRTPAAYDALDFETRIMHGGLSDEEDDLGNDTRQSKSSTGHRKSKDDAWVDILVGSQRRLVDQSAEIRPSGRRSSDPELAREEIARALQDAGPEPKDDDEEESVHVPPSSQDPTDEDVYGPPDDGNGQGNYKSNVRDSMDSGDFEPLPHMRSASQEDPASPHSKALPNPANASGKASAQSGLLSPSLQFASANNNGDVHADPGVLPQHVSKLTHNITQQQKPPAAPGKVGSLIEMYREREKESQTPSKLPVRSSKQTQPGRGPSPPPKEEEEAVPAAGTGDAGLGTARYVHGAPLHNVAEAPEEDDDL